MSINLTASLRKTRTEIVLHAAILLVFFLAIPVIILHLATFLTGAINEILFDANEWLWSRFQRLMKWLVK